MHKNVFLIFALLLLCLSSVVLTACAGKGKVKVYDSDTEDISKYHTEESMTAVMIKRDTETNDITFLNYVTGEQIVLGYHGGVSVTDTYGNNLIISDIPVGSVVDITYYSDTQRLISVAASSNVQVVKNVNKFSADVANKKATYKGTSCKLSEYALAFDDGVAKSVMEVNTEDQVTLYLLNGTLISCVIDIGHGYARLINQDTYVGGMVEIGYDVIVPVTPDMLIAVREGTYTLRINNNGYSSSKEVTIKKGEETEINVGDIAIPSGTITFAVTPAEAEVYVNGSLCVAHTFTGLYGSYGLKIKAEGYKNFNGSFKISEPVKTYTFELVEDEDASTTEDSEDTEDTEDDSQETDTETDSDNNSETVSSTSESARTTETYMGATENTITVKTPVGAGVYVDGNYVGYAPVTFQKVVGTHTIVLYQTGSLIKSYTIQAADDGKDDEYSFDDLTTLTDLINIDY
ncbi:MAG: PEGA domain-containing protein [Lachnospiraceae bacterium]|nr:PEGA domain-containing protein [Lachnospiraceae bacterium]